MIKIVEGNLLDAKENVLAHQTNCMGIMGSGLAKQIKTKYPDVFDTYYNYVYYYGKFNCLGDCQMIPVGKEDKYIANLFGQYNFGTSKQQTDYEALESALQKLKKYCIDCNLSVAIPFNLGCGLAGGNWNIVYGIIEEVFNDYNVTIYKLK
jgi:O-acetyl-ADP-ribose deacetylase (regulator of RNase III)